MMRTAWWPSWIYEVIFRGIEIIVRFKEQSLRTSLPRLSRREWPKSWTPPGRSQMSYLESELARFKISVCQRVLTIKAFWTMEKELATRLFYTNLFIFFAFC